MTAAAPDQVLIPAARMRTFLAACFAKSGMTEGDAQVAADAHVWADLHGATAQGTAKLLQYLPRVKARVTDPAAALTPIEETATMVWLDARNQWGPVAAAHGMRAAITKCKQAGLGIASVRNTSTACGMGYYPLLAVAERMIGMVMNDAQPLQAPYWGTTKVLGNQAYAIGAPAGKAGRVLFDTATTAITLNEMEGLRDRGLPVPEGVALDAQGRPTTDPTAALAGMLLPAAGHRGYGLAVCWELLTGVLAGGPRFGGDVTGLGDLTRPSGVSLLLIAIDPSVAQPYEDFLARMDQLVDALHASPPAPGVERVWIPGERSHLAAERMEREGLPFPAKRAELLRRAGEDLGVSAAW